MDLDPRELEGDDVDGREVEGQFIESMELDLSWSLSGNVQRLLIIISYTGLPHL